MKKLFLLAFALISFGASAQYSPIDPDDPQFYLSIEIYDYVPKCDIYPFSHFSPFPKKYTLRISEPYFPVRTSNRSQLENMVSDFYCENNGMFPIGVTIVKSEPYLYTPKPTNPVFTPAP